CFCDRKGSERRGRDETQGTPEPAGGATAGQQIRRPEAVTEARLGARRGGVGRAEAPQGWRRRSRTTRRGRVEVRKGGARDRGSSTISPSAPRREEHRDRARAVRGAVDALRDAGAGREPLGGARRAQAVRLVIAFASTTPRRWMHSKTYFAG